MCRKPSSKANLMKFKILFLTATLAVAGVGVADASPEYIGWWSTGRPTQIVIDSSKITMEGGGETATVLEYRDITPEGSEGYRLELPTATDESFFGEFVAISTATDADGDSMSLKSYASLDDLEAGRNEQSIETYYRDPDPTESAAESVSGTLQVGEKESVILYFGEESGDYAGWCFENDSPAGKQILSACKDGQSVEVTGTIDYEAGCKVPGLEADLSASGKITSVEAVSLIGD